MDGDDDLTLKQSTPAEKLAIHSRPTLNNARSLKAPLLCRTGTTCIFISNPQDSSSLLHSKKFSMPSGSLTSSHKCRVKNCLVSTDRVKPFVLAPTTFSRESESLSIYRQRLIKLLNATQTSSLYIQKRKSSFSKYI